MDYFTTGAGLVDVDGVRADQMAEMGLGLFLQRPPVDAAAQTGGQQAATRWQ
jgi:hypothetical protein